MDSGFNINESFFASFEGESVEIGSSRRFRYSKTRLHGELIFVKEPTEEYFHDLITLESLKKEFLLGFRLNHPGIVRYYSLENNRLLEEYIEGETLRQLIDEDDRRLYQKEFVKDLAKQTLEALKYLHEKGIAHLDLKPENVMVSNLGNRIKIIDLSCAESLSGYSTPGFTQEYQAPEQASGHGNIGTDIYQLGLILKEITEGKQLERNWRKFTRKATFNHPDNRFRNAEEALKSLPAEKIGNYKWFGAAFLIIIVGGLLVVLMKEPIENNTTNEEAQPMLTIPSPEENPQKILESEKPAEQVKSSEPKQLETIIPEEPSVEKIERKISKMLEKKLDDLYAPSVIPMYEKMLGDENYKYSHGRDFTDEYDKAFKKFLAYGEELSLQYPEQKFYIQERIRQIFEVKTGVMLEKLYPR